MPFLVPFAVGAASTGYAWFNSGSEEKEEQTAADKAKEVLVPLLAWFIILLLIRSYMNRATKES